MQIRKASDSDSEQIAALLKLSLGEISSPKSLDTWRWKHAQNPFGFSEVLVAEENGELAGVRAMMPWIWQSGHQQYKTYRAVDTAVHPKHQGKGLFTKLTLQMINDFAEADAAFVFNTPNQQSLPGYLKMGWKKWGRIPVHFFAQLWPKNPDTSDLKVQFDLSITKNLCVECNDIHKVSGGLFTPKSYDYLKWRYKDNPIIKYNLHIERDIFIAAFVKKHKRFNELRISELISILSPSDTKGKLMTFIEMLMLHNKVHIVTLSKNDNSFAGLPGLSLPIGPLLTIRKLTKNINVPALDKWSLSLGDLELF